MSKPSLVHKRRRDLYRVVSLLPFFFLIFFFQNCSPNAFLTEGGIDETGSTSETPTVPTDPIAPTDPTAPVETSTPNLSPDSTTNSSVLQGAWTEIDLFDLAPGSGDVRYILKTGTLPIGMTFMPHVGLLHGVPSQVGTSTLEFERNYNGTLDTITLIVNVISHVGGDTRPLAKKDAIGFGRFTTGGRDRPVFRVTNLSSRDTTANSLPWAILQARGTQNNGGYILIEAEGAIELSNHLEVNSPNVTLDFRRAPGLGAWLTQGALMVTASNVILRQPRVYPGSNFEGQTTQSRDAIMLSPRVDNATQSRVYIERPDTMFALDETISVYAYRENTFTSDVTIEGALVAEACHENLHLDEGNASQGVLPRFDNHGKGILFGKGTANTAGNVRNITFYGGLISSIDDRTPRVSAGSAIEFVSMVTANYGHDALTTSPSSTVSFINSFFMIGPATPTANGVSQKWIQVAPNASSTAINEQNSFTGRWTLSGGFSNLGIAHNWRYGPLPDRTTFITSANNPGLFQSSDAPTSAPSYSTAFLSLGARVGAVNAQRYRHPFSQRVINYVTAPTPFRSNEGFHGLNFQDKSIPDEFRAIGGQIAGGLGSVTVRLPVANDGLPPLPNRPWTRVEVTILNAYTQLIYDGLARDPLSLPRTSNTWQLNGILQAGSLTGGDIIFNQLPAGFYVARVTYFAGAIPVKLYTGRPVAVI